jgi:prevent-host-death family protein
MAPVPTVISTSSCVHGSGTVVINVDGSNTSVNTDEDHRLSPRMLWVLDVWTLPQSSATIVIMSTQSLRDVRDHLSEVIDRVEHHHERVVVTRNGKPAAVIMSPEDLAQMQETIDVLSDPTALADIREADAAYDRGDVVRGIDAVRQLRP